MAKEVTFGLESEAQEGSTMARSKHVNAHFITNVVEWLHWAKSGKSQADSDTGPDSGNLNPRLDTHAENHTLLGNEESLHSLCHAGPDQFSFRKLIINNGVHKSAECGKSPVWTRGMMMAWRGFERCLGSKTDRPLWGRRELKWLSSSYPPSASSNLTFTAFVIFQVLWICSFLI